MAAHALLLIVTSLAAAELAPDIVVVVVIVAVSLSTVNSPIAGKTTKLLRNAVIHDKSHMLISDFRKALLTCSCSKDKLPRRPFGESFGGPRISLQTKKAVSYLSTHTLCKV